MHGATLFSAPNLLPMSASCKSAHPLALDPQHENKCKTIDIDKPERIQQSQSQMKLTDSRHYGMPILP
jgi:hypothetical protein